MLTLPGRTDHDFPPSVDRKTPTPASESAELFGSPVPAYSVFPFGSLGSKMSAPIAFEVSPALDKCQTGFELMGLSALQIPPPAAPTKSRHWLPRASLLPELS